MKKHLFTLRNRKDWKNIRRRYGLRGHSETEIILKAYDGFQPSWAYVKHVQKAARKNPGWIKSHVNPGTAPLPKPG